MRYHVSTAVWGDSFRELYLDLSLPCQLAPGNLGHFAGSGRLLYSLYTTPRDAERLKSAPVFQRLCRTVEVDLNIVEGIAEAEDTYQVLTLCHRHSVMQANRDDAALVAMHPDQLWADGSLVTLDRLAREGKRLVKLFAPRVSLESLGPEVTEGFYSPQEHTLSIPARELVRLGLKHLHPVSASHFWDSPVFNRWPSHLIWPVAGEGLLARCFHLHPCLIYPRNREALPRDTIDTGEYLEQVAAGPEEIQVVEDSDELCMVDMTSLHWQSAMNQQTPGRAQVGVVTQWARLKATPLQHWFLRHRLRWHQGDCSSRWSEVEAASDQVVSAILQGLG